MSSHFRQKLVPPVGFLAFLVWGLIFALAYAQSPLYTSNQNQYFLHGLTHAGYGDLGRDWLANTLDPTPVFSALVAMIYSGLGWEGWFYIIYALLMGIYLYSLWGIVDAVFELHASQMKTILFFSLLILLSSAGWRFTLSRVLGVNWAYVLEDGVADQRLLGPVLQPSAFGVFLLLSIYFYLRGRPYLGIAAAVIAATFHPTYLLSSAALTLAYIWDAFFTRRDLRMSAQLGLLALVLVSPILLVSYTVFAGAPAQAAQQARQILIEFRIPHHAVVSQWFDVTAVVKIAIVCIAITLTRRTRLFTVLLIPACISVALTLAQLALASDTLALLFPWRLSTFLVPLSTAIILAAIVQRVPSFRWARAEVGQKALVVASILFIALSLLVGMIRFTLDLDRKGHESEQPLMEFVSLNRSSGDTYLIPLKMQDFRLDAGASVLVDFKAIPYRAEEVLEWYHRVQLVERFEKNGDCAALSRILGEYPVTHVVVEAGQGGGTCAQLEPVYSDASYNLLRVK